MSVADQGWYYRWRQQQWFPGPRPGPPSPPGGTGSGTKAPPPAAPGVTVGGASSSSSPPRIPIDDLGKSDADRMLENLERSKKKAKAQAAARRAAKRKAKARLSQRALERLAGRMAGIGGPLAVIWLTYEVALLGRDALMALEDWSTAKAQARWDQEFQKIANRFANRRGTGPTTRGGARARARAGDQVPGPKSEPADNPLSAGSQQRLDAVIRPSKASSSSITAPGALPQPEITAVTIEERSLQLPKVPKVKRPPGPVREAAAKAKAWAKTVPASQWGDWLFDLASIMKMPGAAPNLQAFAGALPAESPYFSESAAPLTAFDMGGVSSPPEDCSCEKPKPKRKRVKKRRTKCYRGTFYETASGLTKVKKERIPCR